MEEKQKQVAELQEELATKNQALEEQSAQITTLKAEKSAVEGENEKQKKALSSAQKEIKQLNSKITELQTELEAAKVTPAPVALVAEANSLVFRSPTEKLPEGHGVFKYEGQAYLITAASFVLEGTKVSAAELAENPAMQAALIDLKVGIIKKMEG